MALATGASPKINQSRTETCDDISHSPSPTLRPPALPSHATISVNDDRPADGTISTGFALDPTPQATAQPAVPIGILGQRVAKLQGRRLPVAAIAQAIAGIWMGSAGRIPRIIGAGLSVLLRGGAIAGCGPDWTLGACGSRVSQEHLQVRVAADREPAVRS